MVKIRNLELTRQKAAYSCLRAYLEGEQSLSWFMAMIRRFGSYGRALSQAFDQLESHGDPDRHRIAKEACKEAGWI